MPAEGWSTALSLLSERCSGLELIFSSCTGNELFFPPACPGLPTYPQEMVGETLFGAFLVLSRYLVIRSVLLLFLGLFRGLGVLGGGSPLLEKPSSSWKIALHVVGCGLGL